MCVRSTYICSCTCVLRQRTVSTVCKYVHANLYETRWEGKRGEDEDPGLVAGVADRMYLTVHDYHRSGSPPYALPCRGRQEQSASRRPDSCYPRGIAPLVLLRPWTRGVKSRAWWLHARGRAPPFLLFKPLQILAGPRSVDSPDPSGPPYP